MIIKRGLLSHAAPYLGSRSVLITHDSLLPLAQPLGCPSLTFPCGEAYKTRATKETLEDALLSQGYGADTCLVALGGGVVTDLVGFLASTYCRGVPHVLIPTTLLAMVDAAIGGKTGVNTPHGKNLIGTLYPPRHTLIDPDLLATLPYQEIQGGMVEIIKHAFLVDADLFSHLEEHLPALLALEPFLIDPLIAKNCAIKQQIIAEKRRDLLNWGHTIGHGLEALSHYQLSHGQAVAIGLLIEGEMALQLGLLPPSDWERLFQLLTRVGIIPSLDIDPDALFKAMRLDKKAIRNEPRFILSQGMGKGGVSLPITQENYHALRYSSSCKAL